MLAGLGKYNIALRYHPEVRSCPLHTVAVSPSFRFWVDQYLENILRNRNRFCLLILWGFLNPVNQFWAGLQRTVTTTEFKHKVQQM